MPARHIPYCFTGGCGYANFRLYALLSLHSRLRPRLFDMLDKSVRSDWPPYNIEKKSDDRYRITMAVAGFGPKEIELVQHGGTLTVTGQKGANMKAHRCCTRASRPPVSGRALILPTT